MNDFKVYCSHKSEGCEWSGELRELDKHLNSDPPADKSLEGCPFTVISCPLSHTGCEVKLPRKDVKVHVNDDLLGHFLKQTALVCSLNTQLQSVCDELQTVKGEKQYLEQQVREQEEEIKQHKEAQRVVSNIGQPIGPVEITMTNFQQHHDDEDWHSPPFYTHPHGYKLCFCVCPKGFSIGEGTHLGVTIHLMRGEFDDQLKWPFRGDITYQLVDQEGDKDHIVDLIYFSDVTPDQFAERITSAGIEFNPKWGHPKVLPLFNLRPKYLKNDCIKLRIVKVVLTQ